jgi:hypothetical protein
VLRRIFGHGRDEVTRDWKKKCRMRHVARMAEIRNAYNIFVGKPEGTRPLGRPWCKSEENIKMDLRVEVWERAG